MSKRSKKNRRAKVPAKSAKQGIPRLAVVFLAAAAVLALGLWWWKFNSADNPTAAAPLTEANAANATASDSKLEFQKLKGR